MALPMEECMQHLACLNNLLDESFRLKKLHWSLLKWWSLDHGFLQSQLQMYLA